MNAIVLDVRLPDLTGRQPSGLNLLKFIRAMPEYADLPVLIFTGAQLSPVEEEIVRANRGHLFYKPQHIRADRPPERFTGRGALNRDGYASFHSTRQTD